jgi:signal transduction histidine kinase
MGLEKPQNRTDRTRVGSKHRKSLRWRLLILLGGMMLVTLLVIGTSVFYFIFQTEQRTWRGRQMEAARFAAETVATFIQHTRSTLAIVSLVERDDLIVEPRIMDELLQQSPALLEMIRLDENGSIFASAYQDAPLLASLFTIPQSRWFLESQAGRLYLGDIQISAESEPYLVISIPTPDGGVVAGRLRMNILWEVVSDLHFGETGQTYVINGEGKIVAHTEPAFVLDNISLRARPEMVALLETPSRVWNGSYVNFDETRVVGLTAPVPGTDWVIITELPQAEAFATSRTALLMLGGGMMIFGLAVMLVTGRFLGQLILQPLDKLRAGAVRIGQGELRHRIDIVREDEVGQVAEAFNEMVDRLHQRDEQLAERTTALAAEVTERKRAEQGLKQLNDTLEQRVTERTAELERLNAELLRSNKELEQFAYVASHDLQEPLRKVQAFGDRLKTKYGEVLEEQGLDYLERMRNASARMQMLINDVLTYSRVTSKASPFRFVDLTQVVQEVLSDLEIYIERLGGRVEVGELPALEADPLQMRQMLQNLIGNSLKFHRGDELPVVSVQAKLLPVHEDGSEKNCSNREICRITVADNGIGFEEKYLDRIFRVFQRLHGHNTYDGTGMGLAICAKIVERHDGTITANSTPGRGTTFIITLPVNQSVGENGK